MSSPTTIVTDGSGAAVALARWLASYMGPLPLVAARGAADVGTIVAARRAQHIPERLVVLARVGVPGAIALPEAYKLAADVVRDLSPIDRRIQGAELLEAKRKSDPAAADLLDLALRLVRPTPAHKPARSRGGRPPGSNPLRGSGFDICVALLEQPGRKWVERDLAAEARRSPSQAHKVLQQLHRSGYLTMTKAGLTLAEPVVLRDELAAAWRGRIGLPRQAFPVLVKGRDKLRSVFRNANRADVRCLLAGPSATSGPGGLTGGPPIVYLEFKGRSAVPEIAGLEPGAPSISDLVVWPDFEAGVFLNPRSFGSGINATSLVITYLDLVASGNDRARSAAEEIWLELEKRHG